MRAVVIEPFTHLAPTGEGWAEGLEALGWTVDRMASSSPHIAPELAYAAALGGADLSVIFDAPFSPLSRPDILRSLGSTKIVAIVSDTPHFDIAAAAPYVDLFIAHTLRDHDMDARFAAAGAGLRHLPFGARAFFAECVPQEPEYDVAFIGSLFHGDRGETTYLTPLLNPMTNQGLRVFVAGCLGRPALLYRDTARIYERTKVAINFHYPYQKREDRAELNGRTFDLAAAGVYQICDQPEANKLDMAEAPVSGEGWADAVARVLDDDQNRDDDAKAHRRAALSCHMWKHRMAQMLEWI